MRVRGDDRSFRPSGEGRLFPGSPKRMFGGRGLEGLQMGGGIPLPGEGMGPSRKKPPPAAAPPPQAPFKPISGRAGAGESLCLSPLPLQPWQSRISETVTARARARTDRHPSGSHNRAHTHTQQQTKGLDTLVPSRPPSSRRGRGIPSPAPLQGKLRAASCGGEGNLEPWREVARMEGVSRLPKKAGPPPRSPPRASGLPPDCGGCGEDPGCRGFPGRRRSLSLASRLELTGPS